MKFTDASLALEEARFDDAHRGFLALAQSGDTSAMISLGIMYTAGLGVEVDIEKAIFWEKEAAHRGDVVAYANLGTSLAKLGKYEEAIDCLMRAFKAGDGEAGLQLGLIQRDIFDNSDLSMQIMLECLEGCELLDETREELKKAVNKDTFPS